MRGGLRGPGQAEINYTLYSHMFRSDPPAPVPDILNTTPDGPAKLRRTAQESFLQHSFLICVSQLNLRDEWDANSTISYCVGYSQRDISQPTEPKTLLNYI